MSSCSIKILSTTGLPSIGLWFAHLVELTKTIRERWISAVICRLRVRHKAVETDSQNKQEFGMHLLYDGTRKEEGQSLEQAREDSQPCLEPVEYASTHL